MTERIEERAGYIIRKEPRDEWTKKYYLEHGLGPAPTQEEIEPVATELLAKYELIEGAQLVLGRRVDAQEFVGRSGLGKLWNSTLSGADRYALLLFMRGKEEENEEAKK